MVWPILQNLSNKSPSTIETESSQVGRSTTCIAYSRVELTFIDDEDLCPCPPRRRLLVFPDAPDEDVDVLGGQTAPAKGVQGDTANVTRRDAGGGCDGDSVRCGHVLFAERLDDLAEEDRFTGTWWCERWPLITA